MTQTRPWNFAGVCVMVPALTLIHPKYRARPLQVAVEVFLAVAAVVIAFAIPAP